MALAAAVLLTMVLASCDLETSGNGKLDGMWHLERIDSVGGASADLSSHRVYWKFQSKLLELWDADGVNEQILMRFERKAGVLRVYEPCRYNRDGNEGDRPMTDAAPLAPYGINALEASFRVEKLSSGRMILSDDSLRLYFKKF